jgi:hypothetical protein
MGLGSEIRGIQDPKILDPGVKKASDPRSQIPVPQHCTVQCTLIKGVIFQIGVLGLSHQTNICFEGI